MINLLTVTDPGLDPDDIANVRVLGNASRSGHLKVLGAIACMYPAADRATLLCKAFQLEGVPAPVAIGSDFCEDRIPHDYEFALEAEGFRQPVRVQYIAEKLEQMPDNSVTLQIIAGLGAVWMLAVEYPGLLESKLKEVFIMGGATWDDENDWLEVDYTASNNTFSIGTIHPQTVYDFFLFAKIPLRILSRHAVYEVPLHPGIYSELSGGVAPYLASVQKAALQGLWDFAASNPPEHRQNRQWFSENICKMPDLPIGGGEDPFPYVKSVFAYDPLTSLWMLQPELFQPSTREIYGVEHQIVGLSKDVTGIHNSDKVRKALLRWLD